MKKIIVTTALLVSVSFGWQLMNSRSETASQQAPIQGTIARLADPQSIESQNLNDALERIVAASKKKGTRFQQGEYTEIDSDPLLIQDERPALSAYKEMEGPPPSPAIVDSKRDSVYSALPEPAPDPLSEATPDEGSVNLSYQTIEQRPDFPPTPGSRP
jgi:hypothetical protein